MFHMHGCMTVLRVQNNSMAASWTLFLLCSFADYRHSSIIPMNFKPELGCHYFCLVRIPWEGEFLWWHVGVQRPVWSSILGAFPTIACAIQRFFQECGSSSTGWFDILAHLGKCIHSPHAPILYICNHHHTNFISIQECSTHIKFLPGPPIPFNHAYIPHWFQIPNFKFHIMVTKISSIH